eukprot:scaffold1401_cov330-Pavlova_lutheri.AAC.113
MRLSSHLYSYTSSKYFSEYWMGGMLPLSTKTARECASKLPSRRLRRRMRIGSFQETEPRQVPPLQRAVAHIRQGGGRQRKDRDANIRKERVGRPPPRHVGIWRESGPHRRYRRRRGRTTIVTVLCEVGCRRASCPRQGPNGWTPLGENLLPRPTLGSRSFGHDLQRKSSPGPPPARQTRTSTSTRLLFCASPRIHAIRDRYWKAFGHVVLFLGRPGASCALVRRIGGETKRRNGANTDGFVETTRRSGVWQAPGSVP